MTEILFYHLTESKLEEALPALLEKSLERGWRVVVQTTAPARRDFLDTHLWTYRAESFLPHGTDEAPFAEEQPVLITTGTGNRNGAGIRFVVDGGELPPLDGYLRLVVMFDGYDDAQLQTARAQWRLLKQGGARLAYWQQDQDRRWIRKA